MVDPGCICLPHGSISRRSSFKGRGRLRSAIAVYQGQLTFVLQQKYMFVLTVDVDQQSAQLPQARQRDAASVQTGKGTPAPDQLTAENDTILRIGLIGQGLAKSRRIRRQKNAFHHCPIFAAADEAIRTAATDQQRHSVDYQ